MSEKPDMDEGGEESESEIDRAKVIQANAVGNVGTTVPWVCATICPRSDNTTTAQNIELRLGHERQMQLLPISPGLQLRLAPLPSVKC